MLSAQHSVQLLAALLETCGRFLYLLPYTSERMSGVLEAMLRLRRARNVDVHLQTVLEAAYFVVKPPERTSRNRKPPLPPVQQYARYLILQQLDSPGVSVEAVIKSLRRLPWQPQPQTQTQTQQQAPSGSLIADGAAKDECQNTFEAGVKSGDITAAGAPKTAEGSAKDEGSTGEKADDGSRAGVGAEVVKACLKLARSKYSSVPILADCLSGLGSYRPNVVVAVVDRVLEELQRALETPYRREIQRLLGYSRLLGELYNFTAVTSKLIFGLLYHLITFGHTVQDAAVSGQGQKAGTEDAAKVPGTSAPAVAVLGGGGGSGAYAGAAAAKLSDPRVSSELDPASDLFRAQVVCELLNACGIYYVRGRACERLRRFLLYFQRYLLTKQMVPLHVEFSLLDTFDHLEELAQQAETQRLRKATAAAKATGTTEAAVKSIRGEGGLIFPRFDSLEAAQQAVEDLERAEAEAEALGGTTGGGTDGDYDEYDDDDDDDDVDDDDDGDIDGDNYPDAGEPEDAAAAEARRAEEAAAAEAEMREELERSEREAHRMLEKLRVKEEDAEFEQAFKAVMQVGIN